MFDFRLNTFLTLCDTMNYRLAAEQLNVTQPLVTQHIHYLEDYYHCDLFIYNGRQLSMTPQAYILKEYANSMRYQEKKLMEALTPSDGHSLAIGATNTIGDYVIPLQITNFLKDKKNNISVQIDNTQTILSLLDHGKIDFGIVEGFFDKSRYASKLYRNEPFVGFCSTSHPFAGNEIPIEDVLKESLIVREEGSGTRMALEQQLAKLNYSINNFHRITCINHFSLLETLVSKHCGIIFGYLAIGTDNPNLASFNVKGWSMEREFNYVYLPHTEGKKLAALFDQYR